MKLVIVTVLLVTISIKSTECFNDYDYLLYENFDVTKNIFEHEQVRKKKYFM